MEAWKEIEGYYNYEVSTIGSIRNTKKLKVLRTPLDTHGYPAVSLRGKTMNVHKIVAKTFIPNTANKETVNHINAIKTDNRIENLEWATRNENMAHASKMGLLKVSFSRKQQISKANSKPIIQCDLFGNIIKTWESLSKAAKAVGVTPSNIQAACAGRCRTSRGFTWKYMQSAGRFSNRVSNQR